MQIARDRPDRGLASTNRSGTYQIERWRVGDDRLEPMTANPTGRMFAWLSPDGAWVVWHADREGNEVGHFVATLWPGGAEVDLTPELPLYSSFSASFARDGWFAASIVGEGGAQLLVVPLPPAGPEQPVLLDPGPGYVTGVVLGPAQPDGRRPLAYSTTAGRGLATVLRVLDAGDGALLHEVSQPPGAVRPVAYSDDGTLVASTTRSGNVRPLIVGPDGTADELELAEVAGDLEPVSVAPGGRRILLVGSHRSVERLYVLEVATGELRPLAAATGSMAPIMPGTGGTFFDADGIVVVTREDSVTPPEVVAIDPDADRVVRTMLPAPPVPPSRPLQPIDLPSSGGAIVQGWLATPAGSGPFPTILDIHGGPQSNETDRFFPQAQAWLDHGFAVFTLNYRGSTGFGREYQQAIWGQVGRLELEDMVAAREWLVTNGIARPDAVVLHGGSYGGFLTLLGLGRRPDLWAAGVALVAIADWRLMHEDGVSLRGYQEGLFEGTPASKPELHAEASPITYVDRLAAPVLIIQGLNDARCPSRQMERYVEEARRLAKQLEIDWFEAGHGHGGIETRIEWARRSIDFVERALDHAAEAAAGT